MKVRWKCSNATVYPVKSLLLQNKADSHILMFLFSNLPKPFRGAEHRWTLKIKVCEVNSKRTVWDWTPLVSWEKLCECAAEEMAGFRWNWKGNTLWSFIECASSLKPSGDLWETGVCKHSPQDNKTTANLYLLGARCFLTAFHWLDQVWLGENHAWLRLNLQKKSAIVNVWFYVLNLLCMDVQTKWPIFQYQVNIQLSSVTARLTGD